MDKDKLSPKEEALLAEARREAAGRSTPAQAQVAAKPPPTAAERLERLMDEERAETQKRKDRMRRYGLWISGGILAVFALWLLIVFRKRR